MNRHQARILLREPRKHLRDMRFEVTGPTRLVPNNNIMARDAVLAGLCIALPPRVQAAFFLARGELVQVLRERTGSGNVIGTTYYGFAKGKVPFYGRVRQ